MKNKKIFISHSSKDRPIIESFIDDILVGALAIKLNDIFCTTTDGTKIKSGDDWRNSIKEHLVNSEITFLIITPYYKESEVCQNEMGASWISSAKVIPLIVQPINYSTVGIIQEPKQLEILQDEKSLDRIKDIVQNIFNIPPEEIKSDRWTAKKIEFLTKIEQYIENFPFTKPLDRQEFNNVIEKNNKLQITLKSVIAEKCKLDDYCEELKKAKDRIEIKEINKKLNYSNLFDEFGGLCKNVENLLNSFDGIINGIIFKSFSNKDITIQWEGWKTQLDNAISRDYITEELDADWDTTKEMKEVYAALMEVDKIISAGETDVSFLDEYESEFDAPLKLSNITFWEECFKINVFID